MRSINKVFLMGNLGKDPDLRFSKEGKPRAKFPMATTRARKLEDGTLEESTEWHNVVVFGPLAEQCSKYLTKGRAVLVEGKLTTRSWEDDNGVKKWMTEVIAWEVIFLPGRPPDGASSSRYAPAQGQTQGQDADVPF